MAPVGGGIVGTLVAAVGAAVGAAMGVAVGSAVRVAVMDMVGLGVVGRAVVGCRGIGHRVGRGVRRVDRGVGVRVGAGRAAHVTRTR